MDKWQLLGLVLGGPLGLIIAGSYIGGEIADSIIDTGEEIILTVVYMLEPIYKLYDFAVNLFTYFFNFWMGLFLFFIDIGVTSVSMLISILSLTIDILIFSTNHLWTTWLIFEFFTLALAIQEKTPLTKIVKLFKLQFSLFTFMIMILHLLFKLPDMLSKISNAIINILKGMWTIVADSIKFIRG